MHVVLETRRQYSFFPRNFCKPDASVRQTNEVHVVACGYSQEPRVSYLRALNMNNLNEPFVFLYFHVIGYLFSLLLRTVGTIHRGRLKDCY